MKPYRTSIGLKYKLLNSFVNVYALEDSQTDAISLKQVSDCCNSEVGKMNYCKGCNKPAGVRQDVKGYFKGRGKAKQFMTLDAAQIEALEQFDNGIEVLNWIDFSKIPLSNLGKTYLLEVEKGTELCGLIKMKAEQGIVPICKTILNTKPYFSIIRVEEGRLVSQQLIRTKKDATIEILKMDIPQEYLAMFDALIQKDKVEIFDFDNYKLEHIEKIKAMLEEGSVPSVVTIQVEVKKENQFDLLKQMLEIQQV